MSQSLVIVESPAKARTIEKYLGEGFVVESSIGHIRDLPRRASDIPEKYKKDKESKEMARLGVDVHNGFKPLYIVDPEKKSHITHLKKLLKASDKLYLATDEDREGESIAWHLLEVLKPKVPVERMVFHEITKKAIQEAITKTRTIDSDLVEAQEARRVLDRLVGYTVSPVLWRKVMRGLSAGRVQSVATRIIVERERERMKFIKASYWGLEASFDHHSGAFNANLARVNGKRPASGKDFSDNGKLTRDDVMLLSEEDANKLSASLKEGTFKVTKVEQKPYSAKPKAPFMTSTMQQEAGRKLRFSAKRAMQAAQRLYEAGHITYMRTDSTTLSEAALTSARNQITELYGKEYLPDAPRTYKKKVKNAQEAHEAIRPSGDNFKTPQEVAKSVSADEAKLYELIWKRTIASQMVDAKGLRLTVRIAGKGKNGEDAELTVSGLTITFPGFQKAYVEGSDDPTKELEDKERPLPPLKEGESIDPKDFIPKGHETVPPARFTEASLVKRLEELGVGRPSTYASTIGTIQNRGYVWKKSSALIPSFKAFAVIGLLEQHFGHLVDYTFTAKMEDELDEIANGTKEREPWLKTFYFGDNEDGLLPQIDIEMEKIDARAINTLPLGTKEDGSVVSVRVGRYGPYLECGEERASIPDDIPPDELTMKYAIELLEAPSGDRELGVDPETELTVYLKAGRFGQYVQLGEAGKEAKEKPKTGSLLKSMKPEELTLEQALLLLSLPREVGPGLEGEMIKAQNGRYGPYVTMGTDNRSLESEDQIFSVTVDECLELFKQPKKRGRRAAAPPLKEFGPDPVSGAKILLKKGRFGFYVTDGETNASLRTADDEETITEERAQELLQIRRDRGPVKKKTKKKAAKKKKSTKKATKKKATKKTTKKAAKKKATKKAAKKTTKKAAKKKVTKKAAKKATKKTDD